MLRSTALTVMLLAASTTPAFAAEKAAEGAATPAAAAAPAIVMPNTTGESRGRMSLAALNASFIALNAGDVASTLRALNHGAREANPLMSPVAGSAPGLIALKSASVTATLFASTKLAKTHPKAAMIMMASLNTAMSMIVVHNFNAAR